MVFGEVAPYNWAASRTPELDQGPQTRHTGDIEMDLYSCNHFIFSLSSYYQDFYFIFGCKPYKVVMLLVS